LQLSAAAETVNPTLFSQSRRRIFVWVAIADAADIFPGKADNTIR
jgi:hypothetical protein